MWGHNMPVREGTTPTWPRRAKGAGQGPRVTTGHPDLPGPAQAMSRHPANQMLWTAAGPADVSAWDPGWAPVAPLPVPPRSLGPPEPQPRATCHSKLFIPWGLKWADPDRDQTKGHQSQERGVCAHVGRSVCVRTRVRSHVGKCVFTCV